MTIKSEPFGGYAAEIFGIFYSPWDFEMVNISRTLKFLTQHGFDDFDWNDPFSSHPIIIKYEYKLVIQTITFN